jgi:hypothetical protein
MFWIVRSRSVTIDPCMNAMWVAIPFGKPLRSHPGSLRICLVFFFWLRQAVFVVVGAPSYLVVVFQGMRAVQENLRGEAAGGIPLRAISTSSSMYEMLSCINLFLILLCVMLVGSSVDEFGCI